MTNPQTDRRDRYAAAIWAQYSDATPSRTGLVMANPHAVADAVMAIADAEQATLKRAHVALAAQAGRDQAAITRVRMVVNTHRAHLELTDPILLAKLDKACAVPAAVEEQPDTGTPEGEAHPAEHSWAAELHDPSADEWVPGTRYLVRDRAVNALAHARRIGPTWKDGTPTERRLVRATTTYTVEAEHASAAVAQPGKEG